MEDNVIYRVVSGNLENSPIEAGREVRLSQSGMFICQQGEVHFRLDDSDIQMRRNNIVVYFPYSNLQLISASDSLHGILMAVDLNVVQPLLTKITDIDTILQIRQNPLANLSDQNLRAIELYINLYQKHLQLSKSYADNDQRRFWQLNNLQIENVKMNLVLQIILAYAHADEGLKNTVDRKDAIVGQFLKDLKEHYREQHEVSFYSDRQYITMRYFSSVVKLRTGQTPSQWIASVLVKEARTLLTESELTIKEISERLNFPNQSYFGKWFKTHVGIGPAQFKRQENLK